MACETIYDHPLYYDILFGWDRSIECDFYQRCFERHGVGYDEPVLEVACGTGQLARRLARRGWNVSGLELRMPMLAFLEGRARADGLDIGTLRGDMTSFTSEKPFAAAFNPMSSFRLLLEDTQVEAHFGAMLAALRPGGIYVLDLAFVAHADEPAVTTDEAWEMSRNGVTVSARGEQIHVDDRGTSLVLPWGEETHLRGYTAAAFVERVDAVEGLRIVAWYPESTRKTGVSEFSQEPVASPPRQGRTMVVLCREQGNLSERSSTSSR